MIKANTIDKHSNFNLILITVLVSLVILIENFSFIHSTILGFKLSEISKFDIPKDAGTFVKEEKKADFYNTIHNDLYDRSFPLIKADKEKAEAVKEAFMHGWNAYKKYCWGQDEYVADTERCSNTLHAGLTIIDSLTTLYVMNMTEEFKRARDYVQNEWSPRGSWSLFEFIIRFVGGFVSIYELSGDKLFLDKAKECADAVYPFMQSGSFGGGISLSMNNGKLRASPGGSGGHSLADSSTYQLEFASLSMLTGDPKYIELAMKTYRQIWNRNPSAGLITSHVGAGTDSYYEYIIKLYVMTRGASKTFINKHVQIMDDIKKKLIVKTGKSNYTGLGIFHGSGHTEPRQEHLATFAAGMIAVGTVKENPRAAEDLRLADELAVGYAKTYASTATGVGPEQVRFEPSKDRDFTVTNGHYMLRPESSESVYVLWKFTGLPKFRNFAWDMFSAINKHARRDRGFSQIPNVNNPNDRGVRGAQDSYFFAETLKYLYLTFADTSVISPASWVFNTEGHPLRIWTEEEVQKWKSYLL